MAGWSLRGRWEGPPSFVGDGVMRGPLGEVGAVPEKKGFDPRGGVGVTASRC